MLQREALETVTQTMETCVNSLEQENAALSAELRKLKAEQRDLQKQVLLVTDQPLSGPDMQVVSGRETGSQ